MGLAEQPYQTYATEVARLLEALCAAFDPEKCNVLAAHLYVSGAKPAGSERQLTIGDLFAVAPQAIPATAQYVALGHVHRPQRVPGVAVPARYAGSLLQLDFGEAGQEKSVVARRPRAGQAGAVEEIPISRRPQAASTCAARSTNSSSIATPSTRRIVRVFLVCERPQPGLGDQVREILPNALEVRLDYEREEADGDGERTSSSSRRASCSSATTASATRADPENELLDLFDRVLDEVTTS